MAFNTGGDRVLERRLKTISYKLAIKYKIFFNFPVAAVVKRKLLYERVEPPKRKNKGTDDTFRHKYSFPITKRSVPRSLPQTQYLHIYTLKSI